MLYENSVIDGILKWVWTVDSSMLITLTFIAINYETNFGELRALVFIVSFNTLALDVIPM